MVIGLVRDTGFLNVTFFYKAGARQGFGGTHLAAG